MAVAGKIFRARPRAYAIAFTLKSKHTADAPALMDEQCGGRRTCARTIKQSIP